MNERMQDEWEALARQAGLSDARTVGSELIAAWSEPHRSFHTLRHLSEVVALLHEWQASPQLHLAAWFHDAIYDPAKTDNEARGASWARQALSSRGLKASDLDYVCAAIMATAGHQTVDEAHALLLDADLSILGAPAERYFEYRTAIREEYAAVSDLQFRTGRRAFLNGMLKRNSIYLTETARGHFEVQARQNLAAELKALEPA